MTLAFTVWPCFLIRNRWFSPAIIGWLKTFTELHCSIYRFILSQCLVLVLEQLPETGGWGQDKETVSFPSVCIFAFLYACTCECAHLQVCETLLLGGEMRTLSVFHVISLCRSMWTRQRRTAGLQDTVHYDAALPGLIVSPKCNYLILCLCSAELSGSVLPLPGCTEPPIGDNTGLCLLWSQLERTWQLKSALSLLACVW